MENTKKVDINVKLDFTSVKKFAVEQLPSESPLREVLLAENDKIDITTFLGKDSNFSSSVQFRKKRKVIREFSR